jgi:DNA replication and repair protein RecF
VSVVERLHDPTFPAPKRKGARIVGVNLTNFRCYSALSLDCDGDSVVLTGANGAGKTNLLEALSMLSPGRGLRGATLAQLSRKQPNEDEDGPGGPWAVGVAVEGHYGTVQLGAGYMPGGENAVPKRIVRINGEPAGSSAAFAEHLQMIWLTPSQDRLFLDGASDRRRFLDRLISGFDSRHAGLWSAYEKAMRDRLSLLRSGRFDAGWLTSIERIMAECAVALADSRNNAMAQLAAVLAEEDPASAFPAADIGLEGELELALSRMSAIQVEDGFVDALAASRAIDAEAGRTKQGPHLTDMNVRHRAKGRDARHCSTGEQKSLMIRLVLAGAELAARRAGATPLLLLDEIVAHLDEHRRRALFAAVARLGAQAWYTGVERRPFEALGQSARFFAVSNGSIAPSPFSKD